MIRAAAERASQARALWVWFAAALLLCSCTGRQTVPVGNAAEHIRKLALGYVQFAATNQGVGPADQEALKTFLIQHFHLSPEEAEAAFVSPRDNQPYEVFWGRHPLGTGPIGPDPPKPAVIMVEKTGAEGTRYIADGRLSIQQLPPAEIATLLADQPAAQK